MRINAAVLRLAVSQALAGANTTVVYATGAIIGNELAPRRELATLPISVFIIGMALSTLPVGAIARRHGRQAAFAVGCGCGVLVGLLAALAIVQASFALFCVAMLFGGAYAAVVLTFRFAAAECTTPDNRANALSMVLAGGVLAGVIGTQLVTATMNALPPHTYVVTYLASAAVAIVSALVLRGVRFERAVADVAVPQRPIGQTLRQSRFVVAMLCGVVTYAMMNFLMVSAPLAMELCGISRVNSAHGIALHVVAMYLPSFFTGRLITRFGAPRIVFFGLALTTVAAIVGASGLSVAHFWATLIVLGLGWNFGFLGASAMVLECHTKDEGPRVQSVNDFVVFGTMAAGSFASGGLLTVYGWPVVTLSILAPVGAAAVALAWLRRARVRPLPGAVVP